MKMTILSDPQYSQYFTNHVNSLKQIKSRKNKNEEDSLSIIRQLSTIKKIKGQVAAFEAIEENKTIAYKNQKIQQAIMKISNAKYGLPKIQIKHKQKTEISDDITKENKRLKKNIENMQNSLTYRTKHQNIRKSYKQVLNEYCSLKLQQQNEQLQQ